MNQSTESLLELGLGVTRNTGRQLTLTVTVTNPKQILCVRVPVSLTPHENGNQHQIAFPLKMQKNKIQNKIVTWCYVNFPDLQNLKQWVRSVC